MCSTCGESHFVLVNNYQTCVNCGTENEYTPKYYVSYAMPRSEYRRQYYSRAKRFTQVLRSMKSDVIAENFEEILELYSLIEFLWNMKSDKTRKYFFSQKVILWYILQYFEIPIKVPLLKNKERSQKQLETIIELVDNRL